MLAVLLARRHQILTLLPLGTTKRSPQLDSSVAKLVADKPQGTFSHCFLGCCAHYEHPASPFLPSATQAAPQPKPGKRRTSPCPHQPRTCRPSSIACSVCSTLSWMASTLRTTLGSPPLLSMATHLSCMACLNPTSPAGPSCFCKEEVVSSHNQGSEPLMACNRYVKLLGVSMTDIVDNRPHPTFP